jgi:transcriptional regulator with PAS, ATPase and Fis domain
MPGIPNHHEERIMPVESVREFEFLGMRAIVASPRMLESLELASRVARTSATVLIQGESGSGKELIARALHQQSMRCNKPWVDVSCGALPEHLMESELFGYEKGAFSGADCPKPGLFELAHTGTLFLDEVGELEPKMQVKLLRVLDGTPYYRLGGTKKITIDVRVLAATNVDLEEAVEDGRFRRDLFHRLSQMTLTVPPLRTRPEDIEALAWYFLEQQEINVSLKADALSALQRYHWPGNVRELRNVITRAAILAQGDAITCRDLNLPMINGNGFHAQDDGDTNLDGLERQTILRVLTETSGHRQRAAAILGISRRTLSRKLKQYQLEESSVEEIPIGRTWAHGRELPGKTA